MRSKKIRIVAMGGFLTFAAVLLLQKRAAEPAPAVSSMKSVAASRDVASTPQSLSNPATTAEQGESPAILTYIPAPARAAELEEVMATPSREIHYAQVDAALAGGAASPLSQPGSRVEFKLPNGEIVPVVIQSSEQLGTDRYVSEAVIEGSEHGRAVFAYSEGELSAVIDDMDLGSWQVRSVGDSVAQVFQVDPALVPPCATNASHVKRGGDAAAVDAITSPALDNVPAVAGAQAGTSTTSSWPTPKMTTWGKTQVKILVPYSASIESKLSKSAIRSQIDLALASLNNDLARSGVPVYVTLAGAPALKYAQEGTSATSNAIDLALTRLASSTDGILDDIHVLRGSAQADLVVFLLSQKDTNNSGVGYILANPGDFFNPTWAFSVVNFWQMNSSSVFSHEVGHNFGCNHDREHAVSTQGVRMAGAYSYSYGHRFHGQNKKQYRTIMSYAPGAVAPYFSNPKVKAAGTPTGVAVGSSKEAYNALTIQKNAAEVSNYNTTRAVSRIMRLVLSR